MSQISENLPIDVKTDGRKDGRTLFYRTLPAETRGPTRSVRDLVLIHTIDKLNLMEELRKVASIGNKEYKEMNI